MPDSNSNSLVCVPKSQSTACSSLPDSLLDILLICRCFHSDRSLYKMKSHHARSIVIPSHAENNFGIDAKSSFVNRHLFEIVWSTRRKELSFLLSSAKNVCLY